MTPKKPGGLLPQFAVVLALVPGGVFAQASLPRGAGSTANTVDRPAADTPVPEYFQASYQAYLKMKADAHGGTHYTRATYDRMPDWSGLWSRDFSHGFQFDSKQKGTGFNSPLGPITAELTPRYRAAYEEKLRQIAAGNEWDQLSDCLPAGYPRWLTEPFLREFIVTPDETWWINEQQSEARRFYTDDRGHLPEAAAQNVWTGESIGFWDNQTLVVHTIRSIHGEYQRNQPDYSDKVSTVERIRMTDHDTIEDDVTVWDPKGLSKPWHVVMIYKRVKDPGARIDMWSCESNNNVIRTPKGGSQFILPGESVQMTRAYRDPDTFYLTEAQKKLFAEDAAEDAAQRSGGK
ncbi:MAG TPA: hypothetical protein VMC02_11345 [Steroidobacteraceae bacterium]|nr:hypothetical protein [Steroidobacteraceae bacterium]